MDLLLYVHSQGHSWDIRSNRGTNPRMRFPGKMNERVHVALHLGIGRFKHIKSEDLYPSLTLLQDLGYYNTSTGASFYDAVGNLARIDDYKNGTGTSPIVPQSQYFTYDNLYRITSAYASGGLGGNGDYTTESYSYYSASGNLESKMGVGTYDYAAQSSSCAEGALASRPHAVTSTVGATTTLYCYDRNGNMTRRDPSGAAVYNFQYDAESRLTAVSGSATASFVFDGDGNRVKSMAGGVTTVHLGAYFEWTGSTSTMKTYYSAGGARVAVRSGSSTLSFILSDHLGSTSVTTDSGGAFGPERRYKAWGNRDTTAGRCRRSSPTRGSTATWLSLG